VETSITHSTAPPSVTHCGRAPTSDVVLGLGPWLSLRTKSQSWVLALAMNIKSLFLALALSLESLLTSLAPTVDECIVQRAPGWVGDPLRVWPPCSANNITQGQLTTPTLYGSISIRSTCCRFVVQQLRNKSKQWSLSLSRQSIYTHGATRSIALMLRA